MSTNQKQIRRNSVKRKQQRKKELRAKYIRFTFCCIFIVALAFSINYLVKNVNNISAGSTEGGKEYGSENKHFGETIEEYAKEHGYSMDAYPESIQKLLKNNKETKDFVLEYPENVGKEFDIDLAKYKNASKVPLFLQWDQRWGYYEYAGDCMGITGCGPTCLSMVAIYIIGDTKMNPKWMADFATENGYADEENGSAWSLISEGGKQLGMDVTEIPLDENRVKSNLEVGNPIICIMGPGDFTSAGHFIVLTDYDNGEISVNDPNSKANSKKKWKFEEIQDQIKNMWVLR